MLRLIICITCFFSCTYLLIAQEGYLVSFTDKSNTTYSISKPVDFLSQRAIERRIKQGIAVIEQDIPVNAQYIDSLKKTGIDVRHTSKWFNAAIVFSSNANLMDTLDRVSFVSAVEKTKPTTTVASQINKFRPSTPQLKSTQSGDYGIAWNQVRTVNGQTLHDAGYLGQGIHIAVIDAGFHAADNLPAFDHLWDNKQILGTKDFVDPSSNIFLENNHGMNVLSIIGGKVPGQFMGTAPEASFWLLRTEDANSETPIEPDYWICAAEYADSLGVDIINTSLGYYEFDPPSTSYTRQQMNGSTRISHASEIAASKGMLLVTSAGNEGNNAWHYIAAPADARNILSVGAITADSIKASFSSFGPTADLRVKPEVSAMGVKTAIQSTNGNISVGNGTSFSAPVLAGLVACLWQAYPEKTAAEIRDIVIKSADQYNLPNNQLGYGIPNFEQAYRTDVTEFGATENHWIVSPNPFNQNITIRNNTSDNIGKVSLSMYDLIGNLKFKKNVANQKLITLNEVATYPNGIYILIIENNNFKQHVKLIKSY